MSPVGKLLDLALFGYELIILATVIWAESLRMSARLSFSSHSLL